MPFPAAVADRILGADGQRQPRGAAVGLDRRRASGGTGRADAAGAAVCLAGARPVETADLSGRTPARLIDALAAQPMLAAPQAEADTGASRAAVQRNLDVLVARGLVREITGQGRFRVWAAGV